MTLIMRRIVFAAGVGVLAGVLALTTAAAEEKPGLAAEWVGTWQADGAKECKELTCTAKRVDGERWAAEFKGVCSKRFCFNVKMIGRRVGDTVRFEGKTDLGEKNGGVYRWSGTIVGDKFTGKYTSTAGKKGTFEMKPVNGKQ